MFVRPQEIHTMSYTVSITFVSVQDSGHQFKLLLSCSCTSAAYILKNVATMLNFVFLFQGPILHQGEEAVKRTWNIVQVLTKIKPEIHQHIWTGRRMYSPGLQKTTQSRLLLSCSSFTGWKARSRRTTNHLLKTRMKPAQSTPLSRTHRCLLSQDHRTLLERMAFSTSSLVSRATEWTTKGAP